VLDNRCVAVKVFFADVLDADEAVGLVRTVREHRAAVLDRLREVQANLPARADDFRVDVLEYGVGMHEWIVDWYAGLEERLTTEGRKETAKA
jgi:Virulence activator alpha C-term